jgi:hypothetical protein
MRPLPVPPPLPPIDTSPRRYRTAAKINSGEDDDDGEDGVHTLTAEEFAERFYASQVTRHKEQLNRAFLKITGEPMPEPSRADARAITDDEEGEDPEERNARIEREREIGQRFHDEEVSRRRLFREELLRKYHLDAYVESNSDGDGHSQSRQRVPKPPTKTDRSLARRFHDEEVRHCREQELTLWTKLQEEQRSKSVHRKCKMTEESWKVKLEKLRSK